MADSSNESKHDVMHTLLTRAGVELHLLRGGDLVTTEELADRTTKQSDPAPASTGTPTAQDVNPTKKEAAS